jgi:hypothetical protein
MAGLADLFGPSTSRQVELQKRLLEQQQQMESADRFRQEQTALSDRKSALEPLLRQQPTTVAAAVGPLMASPDAGSRQQGQALFQQYLARQSPETQARLQGQGLQNQATQQAMDQAGQAFPLVQRSRQLGIQQQQQSLEAGAFQMQQAKNQALLQAAAPQPVLPYGEPPKGYFPVAAPSGNVEYIPQPGTEPFVKAEESVRAVEDAIRDLRQFQTTVASAGPSGTELWGPKANALNFQRGSVLARLAKARNLGALQSFEFESLDQQLPDATGWTRNVMGSLAALDVTGMAPDYAQEAIQAPYRAMRQNLEAELRKMYSTYWYVPKTKGALPEDAQ